jgi:uncharacterized protein
VKVVSDSTPLIALASIGQLGLLHSLFGEVVIPPVVYDEVVVAGKGRAGSLEVSEATWIRTLSLAEGSPRIGDLEAFGAGEADAIRLAGEIEADALLLDEGKARKVAAAYGLYVTGTLGVLEKGYEKGLVSNLPGCFRDLLQAGLWYDPRLLDSVLARTGHRSN